MQKWVDDDCIGRQYNLLCFLLYPPRRQKFLQWLDYKAFCNHEFGNANSIDTTSVIAWIDCMDFQIANYG